MVEKTCHLKIAETASCCKEVAFEGANGFVYLDEPITITTNFNTYYYLTNSQYSVMGLTDSSGNLVQEYAYDPYGKQTVLLDGGIDQPYGFTGRRLDEESGLWYFRNRMFDDGLGRFVNRDPLGYVDGVNLYAAYFIPNHTDPKGLRIESDIVTIGNTTHIHYYEVSGLIWESSEYLGSTTLDTRSSDYDVQLQIVEHVSSRASAFHSMAQGAGYAVDAMTGTVYAAELAISIANEPADWFLTINDAMKRGLKYEHALALLPLVPGTIAKCPRKFSELVGDITKNPNKWEKVLESGELAKAKKYKGGTSIEHVYRNKETGELVTKHIILKKNGKIAHKHFRPFQP